MPSPKNRTRPAARQGRKSRRPGWLLILLLACCVAIGMAGAFLWWATKPLPMGPAPLEVHVPAGSSLRSTVRTMRESGVDINTSLFVLLAKIRRSESDIKAGSYELEPGMTPWSLLALLASGKVSQVEVKIPEGWTFRQIRARIDALPELQHDTRDLGRRLVVPRHLPGGQEVERPASV